jgi:hypothetical protein
MQAEEKLVHKVLMAQGQHEKSCKKLWRWENDEAERVDGDEPIGATSFTESTIFLMKEARKSLKRQRLFKRVAVDCRLQQGALTDELETQHPGRKRQAQLRSELREVAVWQGELEQWVENEREHFIYVDSYLSDVIERFTALYTRQDPLAMDAFEIPPDDFAEEGRTPILTRH